MVANSAKLLDKVRKLIALTSSPSLEEARTSAYQACKLIRKHGLVVGLAEPEPAMQACPAPSHWSSVPDFARAPFVRAKRGDVEVVFFTAKYTGGKCSECGESIIRGSRIVWYKTIKEKLHQACADRRRQRS